MCYIAIPSPPCSVNETPLLENNFSFFYNLWPTCGSPEMSSQVQCSTPYPNRHVAVVPQPDFSVYDMCFLAGYALKIGTPSINGFLTLRTLNVTQYCGVFTVAFGVRGGNSAVPVRIAAAKALPGAYDVMYTRATNQEFETVTRTFFSAGDAVEVVLSCKEV